MLAPQCQVHIKSTLGAEGHLYVDQAGGESWDSGANWSREILHHSSPFSDHQTRIKLGLLLDLRTQDNSFACIK